MRAALALALSLVLPAAAQTAAVYRGLCDASAAVALDAEHFVVAGDEGNTLHIYRRGRPDAVATLPLDGFLGTAGRESDIEGAARIGSRIYWIASHGRNKNGKERAERYRFFATDIQAGSSPPALVPAGAPYRSLLDDLRSAASLQRFKLDAASRLAPEAPGGLNIEGLAAMPDGRLLVGFRNPIPNAKALLVPLDNPAGVVSGQPARFGEPLVLNLRGRGVRSIEHVGADYFIVAGPTADAGPFSLYRWSGRAGDAPVITRGADLSGLRPEALFEMPGSSGLLLLSDDGGVQTDGVACKERARAEQSFRSIVVTP
jgi:hypothetical protein